MDQPDRPVFGGDSPQHGKGQRMITAKCQRHHVMGKHLVVEGGDPRHRILKIESVDRHIAEIPDPKRVERGGPCPHIIGAHEHGFGTNLFRPEAGARPVRGADIERNADEDRIHAGGAVHGGKPHHCPRSGEARHFIATKRLREIRGLVTHSRPS